MSKLLFSVDVISALGSHSKMGKPNKIPSDLSRLCVIGLKAQFLMEKSLVGTINHDSATKERHPRYEVLQDSNARVTTTENES